jgi:hypothetical protein
VSVASILARLFTPVRSSVLEHLTKAQGFVVILKPFPRAFGERSLNKGHVDALGNSPSPRRPRIRRTDVAGIQNPNEVINKHGLSLREQGPTDNSVLMN